MKQCNYHLMQTPNNLYILVNGITFCKNSNQSSRNHIGSLYHPRSSNLHLPSSSKSLWLHFKITFFVGLLLSISMAITIIQATIIFHWFFLYPFLTIHSGSKVVNSCNWYLQSLYKI